MAINVSFYKTNSDPRLLAKNLTQLGTLSCELLENTSIVNPTMLVDLPATYKVANYMYIQDFNRYYFCRTEIDNGSLCRIYGECDVLMSFRQGILNTSVLLNRCSKKDKYNLYFADDKIKKYAYERTQLYQFPNNPLNRDGYCVLITAGGAAAAN